MLAGCTKIGVDGTFKSYPKLYSQLYIIMAWFMGQVMPAAYILLGGKKTATYIRMIRKLKLTVLDFFSKKLKMKFFVKYDFHF